MAAGWIAMDVYCGVFCIPAGMGPDYVQTASVAFEGRSVEEVIRRIHKAGWRRIDDFWACPQCVARIEGPAFPDMVIWSDPLKVETASYFGPNW